jgi:RimJ/RimL family protein N-acetyltransferase
MSELKIVTERLVLGPLLSHDAPRLFEYRSAPAVCRYQFWEPRSAHEAEEFIESSRSDSFETPDVWHQLAIRLQAQDLLVGDVGVHFPGDAPLQAEFGITLAPEFQGQGLAREAILGLLDHLFTTRSRHRVFASVDPRNGPSVALLERVGMRREAHFHQSLWFKGEWADDLVYALLDWEWRERA